VRTSGVMTSCGDKLCEDNLCEDKWCDDKLWGQVV